MAPKQTIAERLHALILGASGELAARTWYKQPAYAKHGQVICFFRGADVDGERYLSLGFSQHASLDDGNVWPTSFAVTKLSAADEQRLTAIVAKAAGER